MRSIVHLSDLHFGALDPATLDPLIGFMRERAPDLVVVTGDLTQRARPGEFAAARRFLERVPSALVIVPGNHDIPLLNPWRRFARPRLRLERDFGPFASVFSDDEMHVVGLDTARSLTVAGGRVNRAQLHRAREAFARARPTAVRLVASHHPLVSLGEGGRRARVGRWRLVGDLVGDAAVDVALSGHVHRSQCGVVELGGRGVVVVSAGTATSQRRREGVNGFHVVTLHPDALDVARMHFVGGRFAPSGAAQRFRRRGSSGWTPSFR